MPIVEGPNHPIYLSCLSVRTHARARAKRKVVFGSALEIRKSGSMTKEGRPVNCYSGSEDRPLSVAVGFADKLASS
jgi:hypothetical protein